MLLLQRYGIAMRAVLVFLPDILFVGWPCKSEPPAPSHGAVNCSFGSYQGSECHFICDAGYALSPNSQYPVMCMRNRQYNGSTPACQRKYSPFLVFACSSKPHCLAGITCQPEMTSPSNGGVTCSDSAYLDSRCEFRCDSGYELKGGASVVSCVKQGEWSAAKPRCERKCCSEKLHVPHKRMAVCGPCGDCYL